MIHLSRLLRSRRARKTKQVRSSRLKLPQLTHSRLAGETLERRVLLSITWTGGGDGTSWNNAANWGGTLPGANDDVIIPAGFNVVHSTGSDAIHSLQSASALTLSGGTLTVGTTATPGSLEVDNTFTLSGGTLADADIKPGSGGQSLTLTTSGGTLDRVTADANLDLTQNFGVSANVADGLTLNGTATLGNTAFHYGRLFFTGSQTLGGTGSVDMVTSSNNELYVNSAGATLTIAASMTVHGDTGSIDGATNASLVNNGKIASDVSGGNLQIQPSGGAFTNNGTVETDTGSTVQVFGSWSNGGTFNVNGGTLNLGGKFTTADLGTMTRAGGTVNISGTLDNTGQTFTLNSSTGDWRLLGGTIKGGTYSSPTGNQLILTTSGGTFDGLTVDSDLDLTQDFGVNVTVVNGLTLNATATLGSSAFHYGRIFFSGSQTLDGTGSVDFVTSANNEIFMQSVNATLTISPTMTIHGQAGSIDGQSSSALINQGKIVADVAGGTISIQPSGGPFTNKATVETDTGGTVQLYGPWTNAGTINVNGGTLILGGTFATADVGTMVRNGGTVNLIGTLDNTGTTLTLDSSTGAWRLLGGTIKGGIYRSPTANQLILTTSGGTFDGLTVDSDLDLTQDFGVSVTIVNGLTLNATATLGSAAFHYGRIFFSGSQTLDGTGSVDFVTSANNEIFMQSANATLTISPTITIHGQAGSIDGQSNSSLVNQGKIVADVAGGTISIQPSGGTFTNQGIVEANTGSTVQIDGNWSNAGALQINGGTLDLGGSFTTAGIGTLARNGGTVNVNGTLDNTGSVLALNDKTGSWQLLDGTIKGGTYTGSLGADLIITTSGGTLDGLTAKGDLDLTQGFGVNVTIVDGLTLNGTATFGSPAFHYGEMIFSGSQTLGGTGKVSFLTSTNNLLDVSNASTTLTIAPTLGIQGPAGRIDGQPTSTIINQGTITADGPGGGIDIAASGETFNNQGAVRAIRGGLLTVEAPQFAVDAPSSLISMPSGTLSVRGNLTGNTTDATRFTPFGTLLFNGSGTAAAPQTLEAMSDDLGPASSAFNGNFGLGKLTLQGSTYVKLVDQSDNAPGAGAEAVYVNSLTVPAGTTLDLNGLHLYARSATINGTVVGGTVTMAPASSTITWTGADAAASTDWSDPNNWSTHTVPVAGDTVIFNGNAQNSLATVDAGFSPGGPLADIQVTWGGEITINGGVNLVAFNTEFGGGTLDGTGTLTVDDSLTWSAGTMSGAGTTVVAETASLLINDPSDITLDTRTFNNFGAATFTGARWDFYNSAVFNNESGATFALQSDANFIVPDGTAASFNNAGTLTKSIGANMTHIGPAFNNSGKLDVQSGTLSLDGGGTSSGNFAADSAGELNFGGGNHDLSAASTQVFGAGTVGFSGGTTTLGGGYAVTGTTLVDGGEADFNSNASTAALNENSGVLGGSATFTVDGAATWSSGQMAGAGTTVIAASATLAINDPIDITLTARTLDNYGAATFTGARWDFYNAAVFNNEQGASFSLQSDADVVVPDGSAAAFNNAGTVTKSIGTVTTNLYPAFNNSGTLEVQTGTLSLNGGGTSSGSFSADSGGEVNFGGGNHDLSAAGTQVSGAGTIGFSGGTTTLGGSYTVTGNTVIDGGEADFNSTSSTASLNETAGVLGGSATLTVTGAATWSGGEMAGSGTTVIAANATLSLNDLIDVTLSARTLNNFGAATFTGARWDFYDAAVFNNELGASFAMQSDANFLVPDGSAALFINSGTFTKSIGTATTNIYPAFNNSGTLDVQSGTLSLDGGGMSSGSFAADSAAELNFGGGNHDLSAAGTQVSGAGTLGFSGGTTTLGGSYTVTGTTLIDGGEADFNSNSSTTSLNLSAGILGGSAKLTVNGAATWSGGQMAGSGTTVIAASATLSINDTGDVTLNTRTLNNFGAATFTGARWDFYNAAVFNNEQGASFALQSDADFVVPDGSAALFINSGTLTKSIGTATTNIYPAFNNSGTLDVQSGTLSLNGGGMSSGSFAADSAAELNFGGGNHDLSAAGTQVSGAGTLGFNGGTTTLGGSYTVTGTTLIDGGDADFNSNSSTTSLNLSSGTLGGSAILTVNSTATWSGGQMVGSGTTVIAASAIFSIADPSDIILNGRTLNNFGAATFTGTRWDFYNSAVFNNESGASFNLQSDADFVIPDVSTPSFDNAGTFTKSTGTATTSIGPAFNNSGTVDVKSGTLSLNGGFTQTAGATILDGGAIQTSSALAIQGEKLNGNGTVTGDVNNSAGTLSPGFSPGAIDITGNYTQGPSGTLAVEIGGLTPATDFDVLNIGGTANLDGTLAISLINSFLPSVGDPFQVMTFGSLNGPFAQVVGADVGNNLFLTPSYDATSLTLVTGVELTGTGTQIAALVDKPFSGLVATFTDVDTSDTAADFTATIDWGDNTSSAGTVSANGQGGFDVTAAHTYSDVASALPVVVTISDSGGSTAVAESTADVGETFLAVGRTFTATEGVSFSGTVATGVDPGIDAGSLTATIDWGDGTTDEGTVSPSGNGFIVTGTHIYAEEGTETVNIVVQDQLNEASTAVSTANIFDASLSATGTSIAATEAANFSGAVATFTDANPNAPLSDYTAQIAWGDGATTVGTVTTAAGGGLIVNGSHTYAEEGTQTVTVTINDAGGAKATATTSATIADATLNATGTSIAGTEGASFSGAVATFSDADPNAPLSDYAAHIAWGDGTATLGTVTTAAGGGLVVNGSHTYAEEGTQTVTVTISDVGGAKATATTTATIADATLNATGTGIASTEGANFNGAVATFSDADPNAPLSDYVAQIAWGDGATSAGTVTTAAGGGLVVNGSHTYAEEGTQTVTVTISDVGGAKATATTTATIADATLNATGTGIASTEGANFNGAVATFTDADPNAPLSDYTSQIAWGDGTATLGTVTTAAGGGLVVNGSHTYAEEGTQTVTVTISDIGGAQATATTTATIADATLNATGTGIASTEGANFNGAVATFSDADPNAPLSDYVAQIAWGDGATSAGTVTTAAGGGLVVNGSHTYAEEGTQIVTVTISDVGGAKATATTTATIADATLNATGTSIAGTEGANFNGAVATFTDADADAPLSDYTAQIAWGDGATSAGTVTSAAGGGLIVNGSHTYAEEGTQTVTVTVSDVGGAKATATTTATIADATLNATGTGIASTEGANFNGAVATFTDADANAPLSDYTAQIAWGDGATSAGTVTSAAGGGLVVNGSHTYAEEGTQAVTVTVSDVGGAKATATTTATIADATLSAVGLTIDATAGTSFSGTIATFTDANPGAVLGDFTAQIVWGDGATTSGTVTTVAGGGFAVSGVHTFASNGSLPLVVTVHDIGGSETTATGTAQVTETTTETISGVGLAISGFELSPLTSVPVATFTSSNQGEPASAFTVTIHWGDGSSSPGTVTLSGSQYTITGSHTYGDEGSFTIKIDVADSLTSTNIVTTAKIHEELLAEGTVGSPDQNFIQEIYRDVFGRKADPQGRDFWVSQLQGGDSRAQVVQDILSATTEEYHADLIQAEFQRYLHRAAEPNAVHGFSALLDAGADSTVLDTMIVSSPEYFAMHGSSNDAFLDALFADALHRAVDPDSRPFYDDLFAKGASRAAIADIVFTSDEFHGDLVESWFEKYLDRPGDPSGLANFTAALNAGTPDEHVIAAMLASDEFLAKVS